MFTFHVILQNFTMIFFSSGLSGRKCNTDFKSIQLPAYLEVKDSLLDENGKVLYWKGNAIFDTLSKKLQMTPKAIHLTIVRKSKEIFGESIEKSTVYEYEEEPLESDDQEEISIPISIDQQSKFEITSDKHRHSVIKPGWTNTMADILSTNLDFDCVFNFTKHAFSMGELKTKAYCDCGTSLDLCTCSNLSKLLVKVLSYGSGIHTDKRRRLIGERRMNFADKLKNNNAYNVLNELALEEEKDNSGRELRVRRYPTKNALNILKSRERRKNALHESTVTSIRLMKYLPEYDGDIKEFGTDPLHLIFWNKYQQFFFHQIKKNQRVCVSIDATGSLISTPSLISDLNLKNNVTLPHVFLYLIMMKNENGKSEPIGQFLSADQHTRKIAYFLDKWKESFATPDEVTIDDSAALIKATIVSFTSCNSTHEYLERCVRILEGSNETLECYIRMDVSHFVKNVVKNPVFKSMQRKQSQFYKCIIGLMIQCDSFDRLKDIVKHALIAATIPFESEDLPTLDSIRTLKRLIKTHDLNSFITNIESHITDEKIDEIDHSGRIGWFEKIEMQIAEMNEYNPDETSSNIRDNLYVSHDFVSYFKGLCARVPLWTSVMNSHFGSNKKISSSSDVEAQNNIIKHFIFENVRLPIRLDQFMQTYLKSIKGSLYTAVAKQTVCIHLET